MKRTLASIGLAAIAAGVLVFLALASRPVPADVHIAQDSVRSELEALTRDYQAVIGAFDSSWSNKQTPGDAAYTLVERLRSAAEHIRPDVDTIPGNTSQLRLIDRSFESVNDSVEEIGSIATRLLEELSSYSASLAVLRDVGPQSIQRLRDLRLDRAAGILFELVTGSIEFATGSRTQTRNLPQLLLVLQRDRSVDANLPREMETLGAAAETLLTTKQTIEAELERLRANPVVSAAAALDAAVLDAYQSAATRIDRARSMLALYAMVLLAAVAFIAFRLKQSYGIVAAANNELSNLNESLEQRVLLRTRELEGTLADLKESQVQLVQAEKMSSLGQLVAGISHEINTPLLYLANNVELISERLQRLREFINRSASTFGLHPDDFDDRLAYQKALAAALNELKARLADAQLIADAEDAQDLLGDCADGLRDLTDMAQSLKDFSRLDRAPIGNFDVHMGLDKTLVIARNMIKHKADIVKFYGSIPEIECSPSQINQVFLNLITNAAQAIEERGDIVLSTEIYDSEHVAISVSDSGCGIPEDIIEKIKDPFFTTKEVGTGTGLGLSIADDIVRKHGGQLLVESKLGVGSKFTVVLPIESRSTRDTRNVERECEPDTMPAPSALAKAS